MVMAGTEVRSTVTDDIDLNGILGLNPDVRSGYESPSRLRETFEITCRLAAYPAVPTFIELQSRLMRPGAAAPPVAAMIAVLRAGSSRAAILVGMPALLITARSNGSDSTVHTSNRSRHDVVIVGGRVAGSATAMLLARLGHDVVVVDQASFPSDTVSTHSIARRLRLSCRLLRHRRPGPDRTDPPMCAPG